MVQFVDLFSREMDLTVRAEEPEDVGARGVQVGGRVGRAVLRGAHFLSLSYRKIL